MKPLKRRDEQKEEKSRQGRKEQTRQGGILREVRRGHLASFVLWFRCNIQHSGEGKK
jgi:hypothetical protein